MEDGPVTNGPPRSSELAAQLPSSSAKLLSDKDAAYEAYTRYEQTWDLAHINDAILLYQRAIDVAPEPDARLLGWLGYCLTVRYLALGQLDDLERGIAAAQHALKLTSDEHIDQPLRLNNLAWPLCIRYERLGELNDLKRAMTMQQRSAELMPADHPSLSGYLDNLGYLYSLRYERFGALDDLERSIANHQHAVDLEPDDHPDKPIQLNNLGISLRRRFERLGEPDDLERAITVQRRAVELMPEGHPDLPGYLDNLGSLQRLRYERFGDLEDLERAIAGQRRAVELTPDGHPDKPIWLNNLSLSLLARFECLGEPDDLERAITAQRRAVELTPEGHPDMPAYLDNFGRLQLLRYERFRNLDDLECAIAARQRVVKSTPDAYPLQGTYLNNLGATLAARISTHRTHESFAEALLCFTEAAALPLGSATQRLMSAEWALQLHANYLDLSTVESLMFAHSRIFDIIPELVWLGHSVSRRLEESQHLAGLVSAAIHVAIAAGNLTQAVEWLNAGRSFIWSQVLSLRSPVEDLAQLDSELARSLERVLAQLQTSIHIQPCRESASEIDGRSLPILTSNSEADRHRALAIEYGKLLAQVRCQSGFESFMRPRKLKALLSSFTSLDGPIVLFNIDRARCDAVAILPGGIIATVPLSQLTLSRAERMRDLWVTYLQQHDVRQRMATRIGPSSSNIVVARVLGRIWKWIVDPVLQAAGILRPLRGSPLPHVTWCPTGPLTQLPIHAAGIYETEHGPRLYDFAVSSYTPSLSALTLCIDAIRVNQASPSVLVVTQPKTPGLNPLPGTVVEGTRLVEVLSQWNMASSILTGAGASVDTVLGGFEGHSWVHLACHGFQDISDPMKSAFALEGGYLTLSDLMTTASDNAELAFLSACQTAVGDEKVPEESMHLAAGMLAVGFKGVIATMWSIRDNDAPLVVEEYYRVLLELRASGKVREGETGAAYALHEATRRLRDVVGDKEYMRWAPFVHFGT